MLGNIWKGLGLFWGFFNILGEMKSTDECGSSEWKIMSRLVRREKKYRDNKANPAISGFCYIHGAMGKKPRSAFKPVLCLQPAIPASPLAVQ